MKYCALCGEKLSVYLEPEGEECCDDCFIGDILKTLSDKKKSEDES